MGYNSKIILSKRLQALAGLVRQRTLCDIGADHGLLPVFLASEGIITRAAACDINKNPLARADSLIREQRLTSVIETRLADGLDGVGCGEFGCCVIAGMGGMLIIDILRANIEKARAFKQLILLPHHNAHSLRRFLRENKFFVNDEVLVFEDGKWYFIMDCAYCGDIENIDDTEDDEEDYGEIDYLFGKRLISKRDGELREFLNFEIDRVNKILSKLSGFNLENRKKELEGYIYYCREALAKL